MEAEVDEVVGPKGRHDRRPRSRCATATRAARSRSAGGACRSAGRARGAPTASARSSWRPMRTSPARDPLDRRWCSSGCWPASRRAATRARGEPVGSDVDERARSTSKSAVAREFVARTREHLHRADVAAARGPAPGGADARRDRAQGPLLRRRARHRHRRRQAPARALGRLDRERHRRDHAAGEPRRPRPGCRAGRAGRHRRRQGARARPSATCSASTPRSSAASATRNATCSITCPSATARCQPPAARAPGRSTTTTPRSSGCARSPTSSPAPIPAPPPRCARAWRRR